jgi:diguanylate cyclase (GGDEF)-like protein
MPTELTTHRDALRYTAQRVVMAAGLSVILAATATVALFGADANAMVSAGRVIAFSLTMSFATAVLLTAALSYRSALVMRELNLARAELRHISRTDQLTGLLNRRGFEEAATSALTGASKAGAPVVALMCDIDRFKAINDEFGHEFGDQVLIEVANVFRAFGEQNGILVARHGGEEFAALIVGISVEQAMKYANSLRRDCAALRISRNGVSARVTISIGLTVCKRAASLSQIMRIADQALYAAKNSGRDRVARANISDSIAA